MLRPYDSKLGARASWIPLSGATRRSMLRPYNSKLGFRPDCGKMLRDELSSILLAHHGMATSGQIVVKCCETN